VNVSFRNAKSNVSRVSKYLLVGAFPGYVWGWFQIPDFAGAGVWEKILVVYGTPVLGGITTLLSYLVLRKLLGKGRETVLISLFAAATVSCYYWFRLPQLIGFSPLDTNGILFNLTDYLPSWTPTLLNAMSTSFFLWWMVIRKKPSRSWSLRPVSSRINVQ
jgi:hypothetical protein